MEFSSQNTGVGSLRLLQGIFPTQGCNPGLPHCRQFLYHLSHQGSPRILEWVAYFSSRGSAQPRDQTRGQNPGLPHCRQILYHLSHQGSPRILEWVAYPFPVDLPNPGIEPGSPALQVDSLPAEPPGKPKNTGVGRLSLLQGNFPTQESNQDLLH